MEGEVEHEVVFAAQQKVADGAGLGLGEGRGAAECFLARVVASAVAAPVVAEVPVEVHTLALLQYEDVMLVEVNVNARLLTSPKRFLPPVLDLVLRHILSCWRLYS